MEENPQEHYLNRMLCNVMYILQKHINIIDIFIYKRGKGDFACQYLSRVQIFFFNLSS